MTTVPQRVTETVTGTLPETLKSESALPLHQHTTPTPSPLTSSRSVALAPGLDDGRDELTADLARIVCSLRPDWAWNATKAAIRADDRPWADVAAASIRGARLTGDDRVRHPNGLRYVNPDGIAATPIPPRVGQLRCMCEDCQRTEAGG